MGYQPETQGEMTTRKQLEETVYERLLITKPSDEPIIQDALKLKTNTELKDILKRMKKAGR